MPPLLASWESAARRFTFGSTNSASKRPGLTNSPSARPFINREARIWRCVLLYNDGSAIGASVTRQLIRAVYLVLR